MDGSNAEQEAPARRDFERTGIWIFDLDNTLYPAACNLFAEVDVRMTEFIGKQLGVPMAYARHLQKSYFRQFGTTLSGLMRIHKFDPQPFLDYVHNIDLSVVDEAPDLAAAIEALQGRKLIYTNGYSWGGKACQCLTLNSHFFSPLGEEHFSIGYIKDTKAIQIQLMYDYAHFQINA